MDWAIERLATCTSTQDEARTRARAGAPEGTAVVAASMTQGRGTQQRAWAAPEGGLYVSFILRDLRDPHLLTLALGNAVADALEIAGVEPRLKWVNDVLVGDRKVAGILVESESTGDRIDFLVCGVGVNVNGHAAQFPPEVARVATTLEDELHCDSCIPDLETVLLQCIARRVEQLRAGQAAAIVADFRARDALAGRLVRVVSGAIEHAGTADGVDERGRLRIVTAAGVRLADHGTVTVA